MKISIEKALGKKSDLKVAEEYGVHEMTVFRMRKKLGIPPYGRPSITSGNKTDKRGHRPKGKHTNTPTPYITETLTELRRFFAEHKQAPGLSNPFSLIRCSTDTGVSSSSLRDYIQGRYVPGSSNFHKILTWLTNAKADAKRQIQSRD